MTTTPAETVHVYMVVDSTTNTIPAEYLTETYVSLATWTDGAYRITRSVTAWADDIAPGGRSSEEQMTDAGWRITGETVPMTNSSGDVYSAAVVAPPRRFVNCTPHPVAIFGHGDIPALTIPQSWDVARLVETSIETDPIDGVGTYAVELGSIDGLPEPAEGVTYIVSMPLLMGALASGVDRTDLVYPYGQVRDETGRIIGCRGLARIVRKITDEYTESLCGTCEYPTPIGRCEHA